MGRITGLRSHVDFVLDLIPGFQFLGARYQKLTLHPEIRDQMAGDIKQTLTLKR